MFYLEFISNHKHLKGIMSEQIITLPKLGESILGATIVKWFKEEGDSVDLDEPLVEVSTDKVNSEIPSPVKGLLKKILVPVDQELQVGDALAVIAVDKEHSQIKKEVEAEVKTEPEKGEIVEELSGFYSPAVLRLATEKGISMEDLNHIPRSGARGRLTKKDIEIYLGAQREKTPCPAAGHTERVKMTAMRKAIADNMVRSFYEAPHASLIAEVDVTNIVKAVKEQKEAFLAKHGVKLSITSYVARAISKAIHAFPLINASLEDDTIVMKRFVNLGVAVSVERGIMVPVIRNCQSLELADIAKDISRLAKLAKSNSLTSEDVADGSITMTNFGMAGTQIGIPIIRYPEVAIVGLGSIEKKVVVLNDDTIGIRSMMHVCLTFDHRVLDGMYGCGFLNELKVHLESDL